MSLEHSAHTGGRVLRRNRNIGKFQGYNLWHDLALRTEGKYLRNVMTCFKNHPSSTSCRRFWNLVVVSSFQAVQAKVNRLGPLLMYYAFSFPRRAFGIKRGRNIGLIGSSTSSTRTREKDDELRNLSFRRCASFDSGSGIVENLFRLNGNCPEAVLVEYSNSFIAQTIKLYGRSLESIFLQSKRL